ncbi:MAG: flagellar motor protein MotB [Candidatus Omnitrophica bacterium]|nr:flagellar motor protein MotB [Candidatus Omnitrophota bacterium]MDD5077653.1 flagellar motor protein MotB [Candidatus Omnitrophota bacterium]
MKKGVLLVFVVFAVFALSGCAYIEKARRADTLEAENAGLKNRLAWLEKQKEKEVQKVAAEKEKEISDLEEAQRELEKSLKKEIGEYKAKLQMTERGLVITFVSEIFFDSGKDKIKEGGKATLGKVAAVLNKDVPHSQVAVEGHTDNDPIKRSGWKSNWELSSARALSVLHYLIEQGKVNPRMLSADGYGEYHPVAPNDTPQNKRRNRRVEIVILPPTLMKPVNR